MGSTKLFRVLEMPALKMRDRRRVALWPMVLSQWVWLVANCQSFHHCMRIEFNGHFPTSQPRLPLFKNFNPRWNSHPFFLHNLKGAQLEEVALNLCFWECVRNNWQIESIDMPLSGRKPHTHTRPKWEVCTKSRLGLERWNWIFWSLGPHYICKWVVIFVSLMTPHFRRWLFYQKTIRLLILNIKGPLLCFYWLLEW